MGVILLKLKTILLFIYVVMHMCMQVCACVCAGARGGQKGAAEPTPGTGVTDNCEPLDMGTGN